MTLTAVQELHKDSTSSPGEDYYVEDDAQATVSRLQAITKAIQQADEDHGEANIASADVEQLSDFAWRIRINWDTKGWTKKLTPLQPATPKRYPATAPEIEDGTERVKERSFNYKTSPEFFQEAKFSQIAATFLPQNLMLFEVGNLINVQPNGWGYDVKGMTLESPPVTDRVTFKFAFADLTDAYIDTVRKICGKVNSAVFMGSPPRTVRLVEAVSSVTGDKEHTITFGFSYKPIETHMSTRRDGNQINLTMFGGHDLVWRMIYPGHFTLIDGIEADNMGAADLEPMTVAFPQTEGIYSATVLEEANFANLDIP